MNFLYYSVTSESYIWLSFKTFEGLLFAWAHRSVAY